MMRYGHDALWSSRHVAIVAVVTVVVAPSSPALLSSACARYNPADVLSYMVWLARDER